MQMNIVCGYFKISFPESPDCNSLTPSNHPLTTKEEGAICDCCHEQLTFIMTDLYHISNHNKILMIGKSKQGDNSPKNAIHKNIVPSSFVIDRKDGLW